MDWDTLALAVVPLAAGGIGWLVVQSYRRSDSRQALMIELYKKQAEEAVKRAERAEQAEDRAWSFARAYWRQLIRAGLDPDPSLEEGDEV